MNNILIILSFLIFSLNLKSEEIPSYRLTVTPSKYIINKNETLKTLINISGYGNIKKSKLLVYSDINVKINSDTANMVYKTFFSNDFSDFEIEKNRINNYYCSKNADLFGIYGINIEFKPFELRIKTKETGRHIIYAIFTYTYDEKNYYSDKIEFEFYVNTCLDNNQTWLIVLATIIALIGLFKDLFRKNTKSKVLGFKAQLTTKKTQ